MRPSTSQGRSYLPGGPVVPGGVSCSETSKTARNPANVWWDTISCVWSPRPYVRVDPRKAHTFASTRRFTDGAPAPDVPYALHLTDEAGRFRLLALDFDAHHAGSTATADLASCTAALSAAGVEHLVCSSGPGGGFHVWIRLSTALSPARLAPVVEAFTGAWPSLDRGPLSNPRTGCVRAPGAPHRSGGASIPLGSTNIRPTSLRALKRAAGHLGTAPRPAAAPDLTVTAQPVHTDAAGHPHLAGPRRPLPAAIRALATSPITASKDASAIGWSILLACAHARMQHRDLHKATFDKKWPGLEFLRTQNTSTGRAPRLDAQQELARQWAKAVTAASLATRKTSTCSPARQEAETAVTELLTRMNA